ncbi:ankyrin, partial [Thozetella sp. PMI_491]
MDPVSAVGLVASVAQLIDIVTRTISFLNDIKNAPRERAGLAIELSGLLAVLTSLRYRIDEEPRSDGKQSSWFAAVRFLGVNNGPIAQLEETMKAVAETIGSKPKASKSNIAKTLVWPFKKKEVETLLAKLERIKSLINLAFQSDLSRLVFSIKADIEMLGKMDGTIKDLAGKIEELVAQSQEEKERMARERRAVIDWVSPLNFYSIQDEIFAKRTPDTGLKQLMSNAFTDWIKNPGQTLWCYGIPGAGKTVFSSIVVDYLRHMFQKKTNVGIAAVYCNFQEQYRQTPTQLLAGIWRQLIRDNSVLSNSIRLTYRTHLDRGTTLTLREISDELNTTVERFSKVFIVVDALDEASEFETRDVLLDELQKLLPTVSILVTSRPLDVIKTMFHECPKLEIKAEIEDVEKYIRAHIQLEGRLRRHVENDPSLGDVIVKEVSSRTRKMFLLAYLHIKSLSTKGTRRSLENALKTLPKELDKTYDEAMKRIADQNEDDRELAWKILSWVCLANRPLKKEEVQHALAVEIGDSEFDDKNVPDEELLTSVCAGLIEIEPINNSLVPIHYSTQEYFETVLKTRFKTSEGHITGICLTYLSFGSFSESIEVSVEFRFYEYAAANWLSHFKTQDAEEETGEILRDFLRMPRNVKLALESMCYINLVNSDIKPGWTNLHLAACLGLADMAQELVASGTNINVGSNDADTALHVAVRYAHVATVRALLSNKPNLRAKNLWGRTPLHEALQAGSLQLTELLLENGANLEDGDNEGRTAVHYAAIGGDIEVMTLILKSWPNVDATTQTNCTALYFAAQNGHETIVNLLIERGANVHISERDDRSNLCNLLQKNTFGNGRNPLHRAAEFGSEAIIEKLLECGIAISQQDGDGYTALDYAVFEQHRAATKLLLRRGAN